MKKGIVFGLLVCLMALGSYAQDAKIEDKELASLVDVVKLLRKPTEANFNKAKRLLGADGKWTPMTETGNLQATECKPSEKTPGFKLNRILTSVASERKRVSTPDEMLNGEDPRYNYSLFERSLKKGKKATYKLRRRTGRQTFVLVPFVGKEGSLSIAVDGKSPKVTELEDGTVLCSFDATGNDVSLSVTNKSGAALSFVLLNHNSRKK